MTGSPVGLRPRPVGVDPRIAARRQAVEAEARRRRRRRVGLVVALGVVAAGLVGATRSPLLDVDRIEVRGAERTAVSSVVAASGIRTGRSMVGLDLGAAAGRIRDLPWVLDAVVTRRWPGTVRITVTERAPVGAVPAGEGSWALVDVTGRVLGTVGDPAGVPTLVGLGAPGEPGSVIGGVPDVTGRSVLAAVAEAAAALGSELEVVELSDPADIRLRLRSVPEVRLGSPEDLELKLTAVRTILARVDLDGVEVIDVRAADAPVVRRREGMP